MGKGAYHPIFLERSEGSGLFFGPGGGLKKNSSGVTVRGAVVAFKKGHRSHLGQDGYLQTKGKLWQVG